jgi:GNAT superfamily N-acetyltransferase
LAEVQIRRAVLADVPGIARVHVASWHSSYVDILPAAEIARHTVERRVAMWSQALEAPVANAAVFIAEQGDGVLGFASTGPFRAEPLDAPAPVADALCDGELNALYLLQTAQRQGIGRRLFAAGAQGLRDAGFGAMCCWVLHGNPAIAFYERLGGVRTSSKRFTAQGVAMTEHCYRFELS